MKKTMNDIALEQSKMALEVGHQTAILVEGLRSDFRLVIEKVDGMEERLNHRADERFAQQDEKFDRIEAILRMHSQKHNQNDERWRQNDDRWEKNDATLLRIETKLDKVIERVDRHDEEIGALKTAVAR